MLEKLNRYLVKVSVFLITAALIAGMAGCGPTSQNLEIQTWYDLDAVRDNLAGNHTLMNDLDSTTPGYTELASPTANGGKGWEPIGTFITNVGSRSFGGTFDGQGYEIRDLFINRPDEDSVGLFGGTDGSVIRDMGVVNVTVIGGDAVGGLMATNVGTVSNCYCSGEVTGNGGVGGLVGSSNGIVIDSYFTGSVIGNLQVGGLSGRDTGTVSNSHSTGNVTGSSNVGGLVGYSYYGTVSDSYSCCNVNGYEHVGGLAGFIYDGTLINSYYSGNITGDEGVGGLVGDNHFEIPDLIEINVNNSYYDYDEVLINGENIVTIGALSGEDFDQWFANDKFLDINERLSQEDGHYLINGINDFKQLLLFGQNTTLKFRLTNDLDLATEPGFYVPYLAGEFNGNGHRISNLSFNVDCVCYVGLFGYLARTGEVTQVGVENINITGTGFVGGLVGENFGTVSDCYSTGSVTGKKWYIGGLVGWNIAGIVNECIIPGTVSNSYSSANEIGGDIVGGLVGWNMGDASNSYSTGSVTGYEYVGGLIGWNWGGVSNSYSTGSVTGSLSVGGLLGDNLGSGGVDNVSNSFWDMETSGQATSAGGTGMNTAEMQDIATFSGSGWNIIAVGGSGERNSAYIWNIVDDETYPFLSWQP